MKAFQRRQAAQPLLAWLGHPLTATGLALLIFNDHIFKHQWPGAVTGKASDVAGLVLFPPLLALGLALVAPRLAERHIVTSAVLITAAGFIVVKTSTVGAEAASASWSTLGEASRINADVTDLAALPALAISWLAWHRAASRSPSRWRTTKAFQILIVLPAALLTTAATSAPSYSETTWVGHVGGRLAAGETLVNGFLDRKPGDPTFVVTTMDAGRTFDRSAPASGPLPPARSTDCLGSTCYRVVLGQLRVQVSADGGATWADTWRISGAAYKDLAHKYANLHSTAANLSSLCIAIEPADGGYVVLVANGRDGLLRRDVSGTWTRMGPVESDGTFLPPAYAVAENAALTRLGLAIAVVALTVTLAGVTTGLIRARRVRARTRWVIALAASLVIADLAVLSSSTPDVTVVAFIVSLAAVGVLLGFIGLLGKRGAITWPAAAAIVVLATVAGVVTARNRWLPGGDDLVTSWLFSWHGDTLPTILATGGAILFARMRRGSGSFAMQTRE